VAVGWRLGLGTLAGMDGQVVGRIVSVNVGRPRTVEWFGREVTSAIWKSPVHGPVAVRHDSLAGDDQANRQVHGGPDKAVYAYALEDYGWWSAELEGAEPGGVGATPGPGTFGDNLTTEGLDPAEAVIGERWQVGSAVLEVCQPRFPCAKLGMRMGDASFVDRFAEARRSGAYLRIVEEGVVSTGDPVTRLSRPDHGVRIVDLVDAQANRGRDAPRALLERIAATSAVLPKYRAAATAALSRRG
jgi:MOSC domain-containing protein YiiM